MEESTKYVLCETFHAYEDKIGSEFSRRDDENNRQNKRLDVIEGEVKQITDLVASVKVLAVNMENMAKEQVRQGARLEAIEQKPSKRWESVVTGLIGAIVGALGAALVSGIIH